MIPVEAIADVRARVELVAFAQAQGIALKRHGKGYLGLCPLHEDRSPSFSVDPDKQVWCCLGACSAGGKVLGGDVVELARRLWNVSLSEAVERLGGRTVAALAPRGGSRPPLRVVPRPGGPRPPAGALLSQVAGFYHQAFTASPKARDYVASRGIGDPALLGVLPVGYADGSLLERAPEGTDTYEALRSLGLVTGAGREHFAGCVLVPLRDLGGEVAGFYGRSVEGARHLFLPGPRRGLVNAACAATTDELILTEGVFDALSFLEAGIPNAVPLYGTNGFTPDHEALLSKHRIRRVVLSLDADEAGRKAAFALAQKLHGRGIEILDVVLPVKDPNQLLVAEGPEGFARTWSRLVAEATRVSRIERATGSAPMASLAPGEPIASGATPPGAAASPAGAVAAKEEKARPAPDGRPALVLDEAGAYVLEAGRRTWRVRGLSAFGADRLRVNLRVEEAGRFHVDTFDLYSARSRSAFLEAAGKALHLSEGEAAALYEELGAVIDALEKERLSLRSQGETKAEVPAMTEGQRAEAMEMLRGDVLAAIRRDVVAVGCVGEETAMLTGYLALVSRKLPEPLSVLFCARSGAGKSLLQDRLCDFCPPEDLVKYTRISGQVLFYKDEDALKNKLLAVDEEDGATQAACALRSLLSSGYLSCSVTRTDPQTGRQLADDRRVNGPTAVFMTTAHPEAFDYETRNRYVLLTVDESKEQTKRILELQRWNETVEGLLARERRKAVFRRHHDAQRLLQPLEVVIPVESAYPSGFLILRREQKKYLTLVKAVALLHQHQRPRKTVSIDGRAVEYIEATSADVEIARGLASAILSRNLDELAPPSRSLYQVLRELVGEKRKSHEKGRGSEKEKTVKPGEPEGPEPPVPSEGESQKGRRYALGSRDDRHDERLLLGRQEIQKATGLSYWHVRTYIAQLVEYEYVGQVRGRNGRTLYRLLWEGEEEPETGLAGDPGGACDPGHAGDPSGARGHPPQAAAGCGGLRAT